MEFWFQTSRDFEKVPGSPAGPPGILKWDPAPDLQTLPMIYSILHLYAEKNE